MKTICICGAGTMGRGIALVCATAGFPTILYEVNKEILKQSAIIIETDLQHLIEKQKITHEKKAAIVKQIYFTSDISECVADVIIEAVVEKMDVKLTLFNQMAAINLPGTILASNTSSLSISDLASEIPNSQRFAGLHFFNPAPVMKLVEVVKGAATSDEVIGKLLLLVKQMGKTPVLCNDFPGFIVNRVARPFYIESLRILEENYTDIENIDMLLENKGFRMGPFKLMDLIGNDINYAVSCSVYEQLNHPERLQPSPIQKEKVEEGALGKKTGRGYYDYKAKKET